MELDDEIFYRPLGMDRFLPWPGELTLAGIRSGALKPIPLGGYSLADVVEILLAMRGAELTDDETVYGMDSQRGSACYCRPCRRKSAGPAC